MPAGRRATLVNSVVPVVVTAPAVKRASLGANKGGASGAGSSAVTGVDSVAVTSADPKVY